MIIGYLDPWGEAKAQIGGFGALRGLGFRGL